MIEWLVIGLSVGTVLGLTGAGGAILAIPMFMTLLKMPLIEATTSSLIVVCIAAFLGAITQSERINFKVVVLLVLASTLGAWLSLPLKFALSPIIVKLILATLALYSLYVMWHPINPKRVTKSQLIHLPGGFVLGGLTTLTGLGGGVILLPWLKISTGKLDIVTSLTTICLISFFSLTLQLYNGATLPAIQNIVAVFIAILLASLGIKFMIKKSNAQLLHKTRLILFTLVVLFTLVTLFGK